MISDTTTAATSTSVSPMGAAPTPGGKLGKNEFLKMLVAQLRHQDPLSPMNADDMAAQLAQFSSLEMLTNISEAIEAQSALQQGLIASVHDTTAMNVLGKSVLAAGDLVHLQDDGSGSVHFDVGGQGGLATLRIYDTTGKVVGTRDLGFLTSGRHEFELGEAAAGLEPGAYAYSIDVVDAAGKPVPSQTYIGAI
ncbi:MAG TPA: flagellar hook capping FlgD N-terminal domain-containing protein, partial [Longimicrobiaceae bacterium]|nr:flagellar hook capping FlgD N-terminal domain-containing protein [Longimicrobiaceae bacterium]